MKVLFGKNYFILDRSKGSQQYEIQLFVLTRQALAEVA